MRHTGLSLFMFWLVTAIHAQEGMVSVAFVKNDVLFDVRSEMESQIHARNLKSGKIIDIAPNGINEGLKGSELACWSLANDHLWVTSNHGGKRWTQTDINRETWSLNVVPIDPNHKSAKVFFVRAHPIEMTFFRQCLIEKPREPVFYFVAPRADFTCTCFIISDSTAKKGPSEVPKDSGRFLAVHTLLPWKKIGAFNSIENARWELQFEVSAPFSEPFYCEKKGDDLFYITQRGHVFRHAAIGDRPPSHFAGPLKGVSKTQIVRNADSDETIQLGWNLQDAMLLKRKLGDREVSQYRVPDEKKKGFSTYEAMRLAQ